MYDYVVLLTFNEEANAKIIFFKNILKSNNIKSSEKLPPHVTIDLYENIDSDTIIKIIDQFIEQIKSFSFQFIRINTFDNKVLFFQPNNVEQFEAIKSIFDIYLSKFQIKENANRGLYKPHATIVTDNNVTHAEEILNEHFTPFEGSVSGLCIYSKDKQLIKKYKLNNHD